MPGAEPTTDKLHVLKGEKVKAEHHNKLCDLVEALTLQRGPLKGRQTSDGFSPHVNVSATFSSPHSFKVSIEAGEGDQYLATFTLGHVSGVVPMIDDRALDDLDEAGNPPALIVKADAWKKHGRIERALLMFRYELDRDYSVLKIVPVAVSVPPAQANFQWHKLIAILVRFEGDVRVAQMCFFAQEFDTSERTDAGRFHPWPRIA